MGTNLMLFLGVKYDKEFGNNGELIVFFKTLVCLRLNCACTKAKIQVYLSHTELNL